VWSRNIKNGYSIYIYIYDISLLRVNLNFSAINIYKSWLYINFARFLISKISATYSMARVIADITAVNTPANNFFYFCIRPRLDSKVVSVQGTLPVRRAVHEHLAIRKKRSPAVARPSVFWILFVPLVYIWLYASGRPHEFRIGQLQCKCGRNLCQADATPLPSGRWHNPVDCLSSGTSVF